MNKDIFKIKTIRDNLIEEGSHQICNDKITAFMALSTFKKSYPENNYIVTVEKFGNDKTSVIIQANEDVLINEYKKLSSNIKADKYNKDNKDMGNIVELNTNSDIKMELFRKYCSSCNKIERNINNLKESLAKFVSKDDKKYLTNNKVKTFI